MVRYLAGKMIYQGFLFSPFWPFPSVVATANHLLSSNPLRSSLFSHTHPLHVQILYSHPMISSLSSYQYIHRPSSVHIQIPPSSLSGFISKNYNMQFLSMDFRLRFIGGYISNLANANLD